MSARWIGATAAILIAAVAAAPARAACGGVKRGNPTKRFDKGRPPLAIGDSVMLGAIPEVRAAGFQVDVRGCRQMGEALDVIRARRRRGTLPGTVVIAVGANLTISSAEIRTGLRLLGPNRLLGLVTPRESGGGAGSDAAVIRRAGRRWPDRVKVLDWVRYSAGRSGWFAGDGLHLGPGGAAALARLLKRVHGLVLPRRGGWTGSAGGGPLAFSVGRGASVKSPVLVRACVGRAELARVGLSRLHVTGRGRFRESKRGVRLAGRFTSATRARGTLRVKTAACDTGVLHWSARARAPRQQPGRWRGKDANGNPLSFLIPRDRLTVGRLGRGALNGTLPLACGAFSGGEFEIPSPIPISRAAFSATRKLPDGSVVQVRGSFTRRTRATGTWRRTFTDTSTGESCNTGSVAWSAAN